jgi:hypothetical protein
VRDVYERRYHEPPGARPLEKLIHRIVTDGHLPVGLNASATTICKLSVAATYPSAKKITGAEVQQSLTALTEILKWYMEVEQPNAVGERLAPIQRAVSSPVPAPQPETKITVVPKGLRSFDAHRPDFPDWGSKVSRMDADSLGRPENREGGHRVKSGTSVNASLSSDRRGTYPSKGDPGAFFPAKDCGGRRCRR